MWIFYSKIEFQIDIDLAKITKTIRNMKIGTVKIEIDLQIEPRFKKRPSAEIHHK